MIINGTFNNISVISWWLVLLLEKTTDMPSLYHIMLYQVHLAMSGMRTHNFAVIAQLHCCCMSFY
jgi:hypothetical protein